MILLFQILNTIVHRKFRKKENKNGKKNKKKEGRKYPSFLDRAGLRLKVSPSVGQILN